MAALNADICATMVAAMVSMDGDICGTGPDWKSGTHSTELRCRGLLDVCPFWVESPRSSDTTGFDAKQSLR